MTFRRPLSATSVSVLLGALVAACASTETTGPQCDSSPRASEVSAEQACKLFQADGNTTTSECKVESEYVAAYLAANKPPQAADASSDGPVGDASSGPAADAASPEADASLGGTDAGSVKAVEAICPSFSRAVRVVCTTQCPTLGRPFAGFEMENAKLPMVGSYFEACARTEAASVDAFEILAAELSALGAPASLVERCRVAAMDERRHALAFSELGGIPSVVVSAPARPLRGALELALENASSGLVLETFAALLNTYQAEHATDPGVASLMKRIAREETAHADLSRAIHDFVVARLSPEECEAVRREYRRAMQALSQDLSEAHMPAEPRFGLPGPEASIGLFTSLRDALFLRELAA